MLAVLRRDDVVPLFSKLFLIVKREGSVIVYDEDLIHCSPRNRKAREQWHF
jgi:hypothetical protein